ncbi:MAG: DUF1570 domain-containing protein [Planctomycetia bacterium]
MIRLPVRRGGVVVALTALVPSLALTGMVSSATEPRPGLATGPWKLEGLVLGDGRRLQGLIVDPADGDAAVGFVQILQPAGRAMELITWAPISPERITAIDRLPPADRELLAKRVEAFRNRRGSQHAAETAVTLVRDDEKGPWRYAGRWFTLDSTADPTLTRQAVVRLEQVLAALEALVPPPTRADGPPRLSVRLCGTAAEYRGVQAELAIEALHPAFYVPDRGLLVAGSDMPAIIEQERTAADNLALAEREVTARDRAFDADVRRLAGDLERQGLAAGKRAEVVQLARHRWHRERDGLLAQLAAARRDNAVRVAEARREFSGRLTHEAWHAYADRQLAAGGRSALPLWLDEGLAQVFETAPLDAGELRLDAPDPTRLKALQELLASGAAPKLEELLRAGQSQFLVGHAGGRTASRQSYLVAWGLAFHLAILEPVLAPRSLAALCEPSAGAAEAAERVTEFEQLVGMPVAAFETTWRRRMLGLKPVPIPPGP